MPALHGAFCNDGLELQGGEGWETYTCSGCADVQVGGRFGVVLVVDEYGVIRTESGAKVGLADSPAGARLIAEARRIGT